MPKVLIGSDHAGFELKEKLVVFLKTLGYEVKDFGAFKYDANDDYPDFLIPLGKEISENSDLKGIVIGGSGQGEAIVVNKFKNVRCALFYSPIIPVGVADITGRKSTDPFEMLRLTREHNDANVLSLGARFLKDEDAFKAVQTWLEASFSGDERHVRRLKKNNEIN